MRLQNKIAQIEAEHRILGLRAVNGEYFLWAGGFTNHFSADVQEVIDLYSFVATIAPGSYGLLYIHDDEDKGGEYNEFQVWRLARGSVTKQRDVYLSPYDPTVEYASDREPESPDR